MGKSLYRKAESVQAERGAAVANVVMHQRSGGASSGVVDRRGVVTAHAALQSMMDGSKQVQALRMVQARADGRSQGRAFGSVAQRLGPAGQRLGAVVQRSAKVVQRNIDSTGFDQTAVLAPDYLVDPGARGTLYSAQTAPPPEPQGLYTQYADHDDAGLGRDIYAWVPNVRLMGDAEKQTFTNSPGQRATIVNTFKGIVENQVDHNALANPRIGMMGKNDCAAFATALYNTIARSKFRGISGVSELTEQIQMYTANYPNMDVGDMMRHIFDAQQGVQGGSGWHAATVVAKQGGALVTLEANVAFDLQAPEFYVRDGSAGFVQDNHNDGEIGNKLDVIKYQSGEAPSDDLDRYDRSTVNPSVGGGNVATIEDPNYYVPGIRRDIRLLLTAPQCVAFWKRQTVLEESMPDGIVAMRAAMGTSLNNAITIGAGKAGGKKPKTRSADTHYFYGLMARYRNFYLNPTSTADIKEIYSSIGKFPRR